MAGPSSQTKRGSKRSFLRDYFYDHPTIQVNTGNLNTLSGNPGPPPQSTNLKPKVSCRKCFDDALLALQNSDSAAVTAHSMDHVRSDEVLRDICELIIKLKLTCQY